MPSSQVSPWQKQMGSQQQWQHSTCHQDSSASWLLGNNLQDTQSHLDHIQPWQPSSQVSHWQKQMDSQQQWQHSTCHQDSSTSWLQGSNLQDTQSHLVHIQPWQPSSQASPWQKQMDSQQKWQHSTCHRDSSTSWLRGSNLQDTQSHLVHIQPRQPSSQASPWQKQMGSRRQWQRSTCHQDSSTSLLQDSILQDTQSHLVHIQPRQPSSQVSPWQRQKGSQQ